MGLFEKVLATAGVLLLFTMPLAVPCAAVERWKLWRVTVAWGVAFAAFVMTVVAYAAWVLFASIWGLA